MAPEGVAPRRALVAGGGIGGLAAAVALRRAGWDVRVFERAAELREVGAGLSLWANAVRALDRLGAAEPIRALRAPAASGGVYTWRGEPLLTQSVEALERRVGEMSVVVHRAELLEALRGALGPAEVQLGRRLVGFAQDAAGVTARFEDGGVERGELLVGADGIRSAVRAQLVGGGEPRYAGYTGWRGIARWDVPDLRPGEYWGRGARFGIAPMSGGRIYWFATRNAPPGQRGTPAQERALLLDTFRGWCEPVEVLVAATPAEQILRNDIADHEPLRRWAYGRVALLGDAAHAMTPNLGQGACQALEDAVALGESVGAHPDVAEALRAYERRRVARANAIVVQSRRIGELGQWSGPLACAVRDALLRAVVAPVQEQSIDRIVGYAI